MTWYRYIIRPTCLNTVQRTNIRRPSAGQRSTPIARRSHNRRATTNDWNIMTARYVFETPEKRHQSAMNCARRYSLFNDIPRLFPSRRRGNRNVDNDRSQHITHCCRGRLYSNVTLTMQSSVYYPLVFLRIVLNSWNTGTNLRELDLLLDLFDLLLSCATL